MITLARPTHGAASFAFFTTSPPASISWPSTSAKTVSASSSTPSVTVPDWNDVSLSASASSANSMALLFVMLTLALTAFPNDVAPSYEGVPSAASVSLLYHKFVKPILAIF